MNKKTWIIVGIICGVALIGSSFTAGAIVGSVITKPDLPWLFRSTPDSPAHQTGAEPSTESSDPVVIEELFLPFWESWDIVHEEYVDRPVDDLDLMRGAISGMLDSLGDQHTTYMNPDEYLQANTPLEGEYEGIGAWVDTTTDFLTIISPMANSPAEGAGLLPGDQVIKIDGDDMTGIDGSIVIKKVLGPAGSEVVLTIQREGVAELFDVTIVREKIIMHSVDSQMLENNIGYIQIVTFAADTQDELRTNLETILAQEPVGLIIDFRNNGGGFLQTAVAVTSEFIPEGVILFEDYGMDQPLEEHTALGDGLATEIPLVLLVNEGSASASEIVAGAFQDLKRGPLVGATTFGKGSVQNWIELSDNQGAVRVTIARWLTPAKRQIHEIGITPEFVVEYTEEDYLNDLDPQLDKAIEVLLDITN